MGSNTGKCENESSAKISRLREVFDVPTEDAYRIWKMYNHFKMSGKSAKESIILLKKWILNEEEKVMDYFIAVTLELLNKEVTDGYKE